MKKLIVIAALWTMPGMCAKKEEPVKVDPSKEIVFGQSGSFTGHFKYYGVAIRDAINAYFDQVNKKGGIQGKKLRLISLDDGGNAELTKKNIDELYTKYGIDKFIGVMGTRGILLELDLIKDKKIALYFPWGSDQQLRSPALTNVVNGFGLLEPQVELLADYVVDTLGFTTIGIFHADDSLSTDAATYLKSLLEKKGVKPLAVTSYNRFTMDIDSSADKLILKDPRVVICIATSMPTVKLIDHFFVRGFFGTKFFGIDSTFLVKDILRYKGADFMYVSTVPDPVTSSLPIAAEYRDAYSNFLGESDYSTFAFSYFISTAIVCDAMRTLADLTNSAIIAHIESLKKTEINGFTVDFDSSNRYIFGKKLWLI